MPKPETSQYFCSMHIMQYFSTINLPFAFDVIPSIFYYFGIGNIGSINISNSSLFHIGLYFSSVLYSASCTLPALQKPAMSEFTASAPLWYSSSESIRQTPNPRMPREQTRTETLLGSCGKPRPHSHTLCTSNTKSHNPGSLSEPM